ncbi:DUF2089 domain-containing protein [Wenzhouxiangella marina]|uniref:Uncharacterized protein n=1 Tax=Wenzhouxiangella marina TaxID=1579979 RepID=A0A0K0XXR0_9GAMM|nr:DUF2089 family protein [Wenzhouxiangella marina]AKS42468.1 hypothetical protein WM2015_2103 [Wenzhouxiangella marina]MBB6085757.1 hypothetical protein [Wenzhouxiangella marina]
MKRTPSKCPSCDSELAVTELRCLDCQTAVSGHYRLPPLLRLDPSDQEFVEAFVLSSGSLKAMAGQLGVSYPTVRNRLNDIIEQIRKESET